MKEGIWQGNLTFRQTTWWHAIVAGKRCFSLVLPIGQATQRCAIVFSLRGLSFAHAVHDWAANMHRERSIGINRVVRSPTRREDTAARMIETGGQNIFTGDVGKRITARFPMVMSSIT